MRLFAGLIIGLLLGIATCIGTQLLWEHYGKPVDIKVDSESEKTIDDFFTCSTNFIKDRPLIIKRARGIAKTILFPWTGSADIYNIEKSDDLHYFAYARREDDGYFQIDLNRVTGEMNFADHPSNGTRDLLTSLCDKKISWDDCSSQIESLRGSEKSECEFVVSEFSCPRLKNLKLIREAYFKCIAAARPF